MKNILVLLSAEQRHKEKLEAAAPGCNIIYASPETATAEQIQKANVILGLPKADMIRASENLELLQLESAGADAYTCPGILNRNTILANATGAYGVAVAEHAFALTLMLQKKLHLYRDEQRQHVWTDLGTVCSLSSCTVAVIGLGNIGLHYASLVKGMGARTIGVKRSLSQCPAFVDEMYTTENIDEVLPKADVIMSILPNTPQTCGIYTAERFDRMKDSAIFINCGRGNAVSADVLYQAISEKKIAAAAVDVTEIEPLPADSPLWGLDNLVITPHVAGGHHLPETFERIVDISASNLSAFLNNEPLRNVVNHL